MRPGVHLLIELADVRGAATTPADDLILATAVAGGASHLVTGDRQLLNLGEYRGVRIVGPRAFVDWLVAGVDGDVGEEGEEGRRVSGGEVAEVESIWSGALPGVAWASLERWWLLGPRPGSGSGAGSSRGCTGAMLGPGRGRRDDGAEGGPGWRRRRGWRLR